MLRSDIGAEQKDIPLHSRVAFLVVIALLLLRFPFYGGLRYFWANLPEWVAVVFQIGTYGLTAFLIWWERDHLADFLIDKWALAIFVLGVPLETLSWSSLMGTDAGLSFPNPPALILWGIAFGLLAALKLSHYKLSPTPPRILLWLIIGTLTGLGIGILSALLDAPAITKDNFDPSLTALYNRPWLEVLAVLGPQCLLAITRQIGFAAISEEPLFRGFLWGFLKRTGWTDTKSWLFVACLFWLGHIHYLKFSPVIFWIEIPLTALVLGLLSWRSRSIASSMMTHGVVNGVVNELAYWIAFYRL